MWRGAADLWPIRARRSRAVSGSAARFIFPGLTISAFQVRLSLQMDVTLNDPSVTSEQDLKISAAVRREGGRLRNFIRRRVLDAAEAEDILQEVLYELVAAHRLMQPIEQAGAWLMRVARNRIIDRFRKKGPGDFPARSARSDDEAEDGSGGLEELLPSIEPGPEGELIRRLLLERVEGGVGWSAAGATRSVHRPIA